MGPPWPAQVYLKTPAMRSPWLHKRGNARNGCAKKATAKHQELGGRMVYFDEGGARSALGRERTTATATLHGVRVVEREAALLEAVVEVDGRLVEI